MSSLISLAAAAAVLLHSVLGCCMHHGHCCAGEADAIVEAAGTADCCDHCHVGSTDVGEATQGGRSGQPAPLHDGPHECEGGTCSFITTDVSGIDLCRDAVDLWGAVDFVPVPSSCELRWYFMHRVAESAPPPPAGRSQARLCVWLI